MQEREDENVDEFGDPIITDDDDEDEEEVEIDEFDPVEARAAITAAFSAILGKDSVKTAFIVETILNGMLE